jgi:hypothetical protein
MGFLFGLFGIPIVGRASSGIDKLSDKRKNKDFERSEEVIRRLKESVDRCAKQ